MNNASRSFDSTNPSSDEDGVNDKRKGERFFKILVNENRNDPSQFYETEEHCAVFDRDWNYIYVSQHAAALNTCKPEYLIGKNLWNEFPEKRNCEFYKNFMLAGETNEQINFESYHPLWKKWFFATITPSPDVITIKLQDITARKNDAYKLYKDHKLYQQIVEAAQEGIWLIDANNLTTFVNTKMCEILEYSFEEMIGKENNLFLDEASKEIAAGSIERRKKGITENIVLQLITKNGRLIWANFSGNGIFTDNGVYNGALAMVTDITEKTLLHQQLEKEQADKQRDIAKAVENAHEKERSEIGRELHDNVQQLLVSSNLFIRHGILKDRFKRESIEKGLFYLDSAIHELRKLSHALVGPPKDNLNGLIETVQELVEAVAIVKDIEIDFRHDDLQEHEIEQNLKLVIYRIIQEQMSNILKYAFATQVLLEIKKENGLLILLINDNGKGFDPLAKRKGIGLKNIKNRAAAYNGKMTVISSPGEGVNMKIIFKLNS